MINEIKGGKFYKMISVIFCFIRSSKILFISIIKYYRQLEYCFKMDIKNNTRNINE